jgi:dCMP deaminase
MEDKRPSWDDFFMFSAIWAATRSSCIKMQTGSVIVKDKRIIASGYNGAPPGTKNCLELGCRKELYKVDFNVKGKGVCRGLHAEVNAMSQIARQDLKGSSLYTLVYPCSPCAKEIVGNGISEVVYCKDYEEDHSYADEVFKESGIILRHLNLPPQKCFNLIQDAYSKFPGV